MRHNPSDGGNQGQCWITLLVSVFLAAISLSWPLCRPTVLLYLLALGQAILLDLVIGECVEVTVVPPEGQLKRL